MDWQGIDISKIRGAKGKTTCPKCSHTRRKNKGERCLSVDTVKGLWLCHHCGWKGNAVSEREWERERGVSYEKPKWRNLTRLSGNALEWFSKRGITQQTLIKMRVGEGSAYMPQLQQKINAIQFNYFREGELVNIKYRDGTKNFCLHKGAELIFYNLDSLAGAKEVIITEGEMDCLSFIEAGYDAVVSVPNGASKGNQNLEYLDNCIDWFEDAEKIYLATDADEPGHSLQNELARRLGYYRCFKVTYSGCKDANELLVNGRKSLQQCITDAEPFPIEGVYTARDIVDDILHLHQHGLKRGKTISLNKFNELLSFEPGYFTVVTGIPNHGKSEFVDQLITDLNALHGWRCGLFSPENYPLALHFSKIAGKLTGRCFDELSPTELQKAISYFSKNFYFIMPKEDLSLQSILDTAADLVKRHGIKTLVIDAWNKLEHLYTTSETQYISKQLDLLDAFCRKYGVHTFLVAHPTKIRKNKDGLYEVPNLYDISGSANFFNKAANGLTVYRRFYPDGHSHTEVYVQKVKFKHWGKIGYQEMGYHLPSGRYHELGTPVSGRDYLLG